MANAPEDLDGMVEGMLGMFEERARQLLVSSGLALGPRLFDLCCTGPLLVSDREEAIARAKDLYETITVSGEVTQGVRIFRDVKNGPFTGRVGYAEKGKPVICMLKGITQVTDTDGPVGYMSLVVGYAIQPNGSKAHHNL